jgi:endo-1,4-beta-xylanase
MTYADMGGWGRVRVRADLSATLRVIRGALDDPDAPVPWFRAPNGSWGCTASVAVELGMQPLGVTGTIDDWRTQDVATLTDNLRAAMRPGGIVLAHDGGGDRWGTVAAVRHVLPEWVDAGWRFTRPAHPDLDGVQREGP